MKQAYIWTREHSPDRLRRLDAAAYAWENLFFEPKDRGHYLPIQYAPKPHSGWSAFEKFKAMLDGNELEVHLQVITARAWFVRELYLRACALTRERCPDLDARHFLDGERLGERRIVFHSERHALSRHHLWTALWWLVKEDTINITETWFREPCTAWGRPLSIITEDRGFDNTKDPAHTRYVVVLDVEKVDDSIKARVVASIREHGAPDVSAKPISFDFDEFRDDFIELSEPELVFLNWAEARRSLSESDKALLKAAGKADFAAIRQALAEGASPNVTNGEDPVLGLVIQGWQNHLGACDAKDEDLPYYGIAKPERRIPLDEMLDVLKLLLEAGAHPDCFDPGGVPAITTAALAQEAKIAELLLDHGADPSVSPYWDDGLGMCPAAWDYAVTDGFSLNEAGAREVYYAMVRRRSSTMFEQTTEDQDRIDAELPDAQRSWRRREESESKPPLGLLPESQAKIDSEENAALAFVKAWNRLDPEEFLDLLAPDARYASQWVFEELAGAAIANYLRGKMNTIRKNGTDNPDSRVRVEIGRTIEGDRPCAIMTQGDHQALVLFEIRNGKITRYDVCIPDYPWFYSRRRQSRLMTPCWH
ncbi:MAG: hypothetical protein LBU43_04530 [Candidatus Accumulibacter sp.]|jgi:hypothetical protein|nr:hypothetical protein [Accumulibacter sp.]